MISINVSPDIAAAPAPSQPDQLSQLVEFGLVNGLTPPPEDVEPVPSGYDDDDDDGPPPDADDDAMPPDVAAKPGKKKPRKKAAGAGQPPPPSDAADDTHDENGKPWVELPRDNLQIGEKFASDLGFLLASHGLYRRDKVVVWVNQDDPENAGFEIVSPMLFRTFVEQVVSPFKWKSVKVAPTDEEPDPEPRKYRAKKTMTGDVAGAVLASRQFRRWLPRVLRLNTVSLPVVRPGGKLELLPPGYDAQTESFTLHSDIEIKRMAHEDAFELLDSELLGEIPFADARSKAAQIAAMFSPFCSLLFPRHSMRPIFAWNANSIRAGKTISAKCAITPVFGPAAVTDFKTDREKFADTMDAKMLAGVEYALLDNIKTHVDSPVLEALATSPFYSGRVKGLTQDFRVPNFMHVYLTGNGMTLSTDLEDRTLRIDLYEPEVVTGLKTFKFELNDVWLANPINRGRILSAMWSLLDIYWSAGCPDNKSPHKLRAPEWSDLMSRLLACAGDGKWADPCERPKHSVDQDLTHMRLLVSEMSLRAGGIVGQGDNEWTFRQITDLACELSLFDWFMPDKGDKVQPKERSKFGKLLARFSGEKGKVFRMPAGSGESAPERAIKLEKLGDGHNRNGYRVMVMS